MDWTETIKIRGCGIAHQQAVLAMKQQKVAFETKLGVSALMYQLARPEKWYLQWRIDSVQGKGVDKGWGDELGLEYAYIEVTLIELRRLCIYLNRVYIQQYLIQSE